MPPTTCRDFQKAAKQRFQAASVLFRGRMMLDAQYVGGYTVECAFKALILQATPAAERALKLQTISSGARMHRTDILRGELTTLGIQIPATIAKRLKRFRWGTQLRYESGHADSGETAGFLKTAKMILDWVEAQLP